jgi:hypothetical protein
MVLELVVNEVQGVECALGAWLHLLHVIEVEVDPHLKHKQYIRKATLPGAPTVGVF